MMLVLTTERATLQTRRFAAGRSTFEVDCPSADVRDAVEALFVDLPNGRSDDPCSTIELVPAERDWLELKVDDGRHISAQPFDGAMASMATAVTRLALDADAEQLHLHCAALSFNGAGVLISAASGTGKTTLAAALAKSGWTYVSDESVSLKLGSLKGLGFAKPLIFKPGDTAVRSELGLGGACAADPDTWCNIPVSSLPATVASELTPSVIVVLHRRPDGSLDPNPQATPMHPADAVVALMSQTMDAERFGPESVFVLAEMAARCRCVTLPAGDLNIATGVIHQLVQAQHEPASVQLFDLSAGSSGIQPIGRISPEVRSVQLGDRMVVFQTASGAIAALDEAGSAVWQALHGRPPSWWDPATLESPTTAGFLEQLASHGMIIRPEQET